MVVGYKLQNSQNCSIEQQTPKEVKQSFPRIIIIIIIPKFIAMQQPSEISELECQTVTPAIACAQRSADQTLPQYTCICVPGRIYRIQPLLTRGSMIFTYKQKVVKGEEAYHQQMTPKLNKGRFSVDSTQYIRSERHKNLYNIVIWTHKRITYSSQRGNRHTDGYTNDYRTPRPMRQG